MPNLLLAYGTINTMGKWRCDRGVIFCVKMGREGNPYTVNSLMTRILRRSTTDLDVCQWQTRVQTQMAPNSSSLSCLVHGWMASMSCLARCSPQTIYEVTRELCMNCEHKKIAYVWFYQSIFW